MTEGCCRDVDPDPPADPAVPGGAVLAGNEADEPGPKTTVAGEVSSLLLITGVNVSEGLSPRLNKRLANKIF